MTALRASRTYLVIGTACVLGFAGGALLAATDASAILFYALGALLVGLSAVQSLRPGVGLRPLRGSQRGPRSDAREPVGSASEPVIEDEVQAPSPGPSERPRSEEPSATRTRLIAVTADDLTAAEQVAVRTTELQRAHEIELDDMVIVERLPEGKVKLHQPSPAGANAASGALWGGLIGLIFLMPLFGMAIGAASGAVAGAMSDYGIDDTFMKDLGAELAPGNAAVLLLIHGMSGDEVLARVGIEGRILRASLDASQEERLAAALDAAQSR